MLAVIRILFGNSSLFAGIFAEEILKVSNAKSVVILFTHAHALSIANNSGIINSYQFLSSIANNSELLAIDDKNK